MKIRVITYATDDFRQRAESMAKAIANLGVKKIKIYTPNDIDAEFLTKNKAIFKEKKGGGAWLWKPYIIKKELSKCEADEILLYLDSGRDSYWEPWVIPQVLVEGEIMVNQGFVLGPVISHLGAIEEWTKKETLKLMGVNKDELKNIKMLQMNWSFWTNRAQATQFLDEWLWWCQVRECVSGENVEKLYNYPGFKEHRYDQSIVSILAYKNKIRLLDYSSKKIFKTLELRPKSSFANLAFKNLSNIDYFERDRVVAFWIRNIYWMKLRRIVNLIREIAVGHSVKKVYRIFKWWLGVVRGYYPILCVKHVSGKIKRHGSEYGGWYYNEDHLKGGEIIVAGVGEDLSFEIELYRKRQIGYTFFDPTPKAINYWKQLSSSSDECIKKMVEVSTYEPEALWIKTGSIAFSLPRNIDYVSGKIDHDSVTNSEETKGEIIEVRSSSLVEYLEKKDIKTISLLKLDIEGAEIAVLEDMLNNGIYPIQLLVEFDVLANKTKIHRRKFDCIHRYLCRQGYILFKREGYNFSYLKGVK